MNGSNEARRPIKRAKQECEHFTRETGRASGAGKAVRVIAAQILHERATLPRKHKSRTLGKREERKSAGRQAGRAGQGRGGQGRAGRHRGRQALPLFAPFRGNYPFSHLFAAMYTPFRTSSWLIAPVAPDDKLPPTTSCSRRQVAPRQAGITPVRMVSDERTLGYLSAAFGSSRIASSAYQKWPTLNAPFAVPDQSSIQHLLPI